MGEELASSYLRIKLSTILVEAEADSGSSSGIISRIKSLKDDSPMIPVDRLHELIESVLEWRVFRHTAAASKKGWMDFPKLLLHPLSKMMFNRRMRSRLESIERMLARGRRRPPPPPAARRAIEQTRPIEDASHIIGCEAEIEQIEAWLLPQAEWRAAGIVGRCGCGKTALAQKVFGSPRIEKAFSPRIWVCLSSMQFNEERVDPRARVLIHILKEMGQDYSDEHYSLDQLQEALVRGLQGKRYLIVLDDAWPLDNGTINLREILPAESGGAVIVTSRLENAVGKMVGNDKHVLRVEPQLSDEICRQIFIRVFQQQQEKLDPEHVKLAAIQDDLKRNIDRLPLAATTLGTILPGLLLKSCWMPARDIRITWGSDARYWRWIRLPPPQQEEEVAELLAVCWLDIKVTVTMKKFLLKTSYSAYLVFKLDKDSDDLDEGKGRLKIYRDGNLESDEERTVFINYWKNSGTVSNEEEEERQGRAQYFPQSREGVEGEQGWMEIKLGEFVPTSEDDGRSVEPAFEVITSDWKSGLFVKGIEIRPNYPHN